MAPPTHLLQFSHHVSRQPGGVVVRAQGLKDRQADLGVLLDGGPVDLLRVDVAVVEAPPRNEQHRARADQARDHLPPREIVDEGSLVLDVVQHPRRVLRRRDAAALTLLDPSTDVIIRRGWAGVHLDHAEGLEVGAMQEGAEMVEFDCEHFPLEGLLKPTSVPDFKEDDIHT